MSCRWLTARIRGDAHVFARPVSVDLIAGTPVHAPKVGVLHHGNITNAATEDGRFSTDLETASVVVLVYAPNGAGIYRVLMITSDKEQAEAYVEQCSDDQAVWCMECPIRWDVATSDGDVVVHG